MTYSPFTATGNGSTTAYSIAFDYINSSDVKAKVNNVVTTAFSVSGSTVTFTTAPPSGQSVVIYRTTDNATIQADFQSGSALRAVDLNDNFTQLLYVTQESTDTSDEANTDAAAAVVTANTASTNATNAVNTANAASTAATNATNTANSASTTATNAANQAASAAASASNAVTTANNADSDATTAVATANTASTNASNAVSTANTASTNATAAVNSANTAVSTANTASTNASNAVTTANAASANATTALNNSRESDGSGGYNTAISKANTAVTTANTASSNATTAVSTANTASTNASSAVTTANTANATANAAAATVASAVFYTPVANFASFPSSPSNQDRIEVTDSTGLQSQSIVAGIPSGFTGSSDLTMRLEYNSSTSKWDFKQYFAEDPEARYMPKQGGTMTGLLTLSGAPTANLHAATKTYVDSANTSQDSTISTNTSNISTNTSNISTNTSNIATNTSNISSNTTAIGTKLALAGGTLTGALTLSGNPTTDAHAATKAYVDLEVAGVVDTAPAALNTLNELAAALGDDANFSTTVTNSIGTKMPLAGGTFTGDVTFNSGQVFPTYFANQAAFPSASTYHGAVAHSHSDGAMYFAHGGSWNKLANNSDIPTNNNQLTNGAGYVTSSGNTIIGTDSDIDTSGATIIDNLYMTDGVITSHGTRTLTLANLGYTGATNANYITNTNQLTNGAGFITSANGGNAATLDSIDSSQFLRSDTADTASGDITFSGGAGAATIAANSDIRFTSGTWTGETNAKIQYHGNILYIQYPSYIYFRNSSGTDRFKIDTSGNIYGINDITCGEIEFSGEIKGSDGDYIKLGTSNDLQLVHNGTNSYIDNFTGHVNITNYANDQDIALATDNGSGGTANYILCDGGTGQVWLYYYGSWKLATNSSGVSINGSLTATGNVTAYSDITLKDNIETIPDALNKVSQIRGVTFDRNDLEDAPRQTGVIAQEVEKVLPEVVSKTEDGLKTVAYGNIVGLLIESIKELKSEVDELKAKLEAK